MATAVSTISKTEQAAQLRAEAAALDKEISQLKAKLEHARRRSGELQDKRKAMEQEAARGQQPKPGAVATLLTELAEAQLPVDGLTPVVAEQQAKLTAVRETLAILDRALSIEAQQQALQRRFDSLKKKGGEVVPQISASIRRLLELLAEWDQIRDALRLEFSDSDKTDAARELLRAYGEQLWDRSAPRVESEMLKEGFVIRGDLQFMVHNLTPPKP